MLRQLYQFTRDKYRLSPSVLIQHTTELNRPDVAHYGGERAVGSGGRVGEARVWLWMRIGWETGWNWVTPAEPGLHPVDDVP